MVQRDRPVRQLPPPCWRRGDLVVGNTAFMSKLRTQEKNTFLLWWNPLHFKSKKETFMVSGGSIREAIKHSNAPDGNRSNSKVTEN
jgi:hypothetical protein